MRRQATRLICAAALVALILALAAESATPGGGPVRASGSWTDSFDSTTGISVSSGVKVWGGSLKLAEAVPPVDLGSAVPGETAVYAVLATTLGHNNVYCGTGQRGHLVEHDPEELYQEAYQGPAHWGVSNSRGQAVTTTTPAQARVTALAAAGSYIYGGTYPDGHLFKYDPADPGSPSSDLGTCMGASGAILSLAYIGGAVYGGTESGHVFSYNGSFTNLGQPGGSAPVRVLVVSGGALLMGSGNGHLYRYAGGGQGAFTDLGLAASSSINALAISGTVVYIGAGTDGGTDGRLFSYDTVAPGVFNDLGQTPGSTACIRALVVSGGSVYVGSQGGHLFKYQRGWQADADQGVPANSGGASINSLSVASDGTVYGGTGTADPGSKGHLFRQSRNEDYGAAPDGSAVTGVTYSGKKVFLTTAAGNLYSFTGPGAFNLLGSTGGSAINDLDSNSGYIYMGCESGHLWLYDGNAFRDMGAPPSPASPVRAVRSIWGRVFIGLADGRIYQSPATPGTLSLLAQLPGGAAVNDIVTPATGTTLGTLYIAGANGHLYSLANGVLTDIGSPMSETTALNALGIYNGKFYTGYQSGKLYSYDGTVFSAALGDCGSPIRSIAAGSQGVMCGTENGKLMTYESTLRQTGMAPGATAVRSLCHINGHVFGGTQGARLFSQDDAFLGDEGQVVEKQITVFCMAYDAARNLIYGGTYRNAHFLVIDPSTNKVIDRGRPINGEREIEDMLVTSGGKVCGATYGGTTDDLYNPGGGHLFTYDPASGRFTDKGNAPAPDNNWWISALVEAPGGGLVYGATGNSTVDASHQEGRLFSWNPDTNAKVDLGVPVAGETTLSLTVSGGMVFGGTWKTHNYTVSHVYVYQPGGGFTTLGESPPAPDGQTMSRYVMRMSATGGKVYCGQYNGYVFRFNDTDRTQLDYAANLEVLGKPVSDCNGVSELVPGPDGTVLCGTANDVETPKLGHVSSYDTALGQFRDIARYEAPGHIKVQSLARAQATGGALFAGTGVGLDATGESTDGAHIFRIDPYKTGGGCEAASTVITPRVVELGVPASGQSISVLCAGPRGQKWVYGGTANGEVFIYDTMSDGVFWRKQALSGQAKVLSLSTGPDGKVYGGTGNDPSQPGTDAHLFRVDLNYPGQVEDLGAPTSAEYQGTRGIFSIAAGSNGKIYFGTGDHKNGTSWYRGRLYEYDPATRQFTDKGEVGSASGRLSVLVGASDGFIYGGTGTSPGQTGGSARLVKFNPAAGTMSSVGSFGTELGLNAIVESAPGKLYCGTGPAGGLYSYNLSGGTPQQLPGWPHPGSAVTTLAAAGGSVYGCAGGGGDLFRFTPGSGFTDMGPLTSGNTGVAAATTDNLGKPHFGTSGDDRLVRYDPNLRFAWDRVTFSKTDAPPGTQAHVDIRNEAGSADLMTDLSSGTDVSGLATAEGLRLKARLSTSDTALTPSIAEWGVSWRLLPAIDQLTYPHAQGVYAGEPVDIWGSNFGGSQGTVTIDGVAASVLTWVNNLVQVQVPASTSAGQLTIALPGGASVDGSIQILPGPHIGQGTAASGRVGEVIEIRGSGFMASRGSGDGVSFNGKPATAYDSWADDLIRVTVPSGATSGGLVVSVNGHPSDPFHFTVLPGGDPTVRITGPPNGSTVSGSVTVSATVERTGGSDPVELWVDGAKVGTDAGAPFIFTWDSEPAADGEHTLAVKAKDNIGREGSASVTLYTNHSVPSAGGHWYFAEGCTAKGFETWLLIENPGAHAASARVRFMDDSGAITIKNCDLPPKSRTTVNAAEVVPGANFAMEVTADRKVICERSMYWGNRVEGSDTIGSTSLSRTWYFAEGCTDYGFDTYVLLANPGDQPVSATLRYMYPRGGGDSVAHSVPAHSRLTVNAAADVGAREFSVKADAGAAGAGRRALGILRRHALRNGDHRVREAFKDLVPFRGFHQLGVRDLAPNTAPGGGRRQGDRYLPEIHGGDRGACLRREGAVAIYGQPCRGGRGGGRLHALRIG